ncbi:MAG TPA: DUF4870 domain-containing protein [Thermoanaerobaculia bacterium]|nr:DUF4870 domain-containing protein [Thermoanaerobaculia bacterium]
MSEPLPPPPPSYAPPPPPPAGGASSNRTLMLVLAYLFPIIPFIVEKDDKEVQWHAKHGLVLAGACLVACVGLVIVGHIPVLGCFAGCLGWVVLGLAYTIVLVLAIIKATNNERFIIPGLSQFADKF